MKQTNLFVRDFDNALELLVQYFEQVTGRLKGRNLQAGIRLNPAFLKKRPAFLTDCANPANLTKYPLTAMLHLGRYEGTFAGIDIFGMNMFDKAQRTAAPMVEILTFNLNEINTRVLSARVQPTEVLSFVFDTTNDAVDNSGMLKQNEEVDSNLADGNPVTVSEVIEDIKELCGTDGNELSGNLELHVNRSLAGSVGFRGTCEEGFRRFFGNKIPSTEGYSRFLGVIAGIPTYIEETIGGDDYVVRVYDSTTRCEISTYAWKAKAVTHKAVNIGKAYEGTGNRYANTFSEALYDVLSIHKGILEKVEAGELNLNGGTLAVRMNPAFLTEENLDILLNRTAIVTVQSTTTPPDFAGLSDYVCTFRGMDIYMTNEAHTATGCPRPKAFIFANKVYDSFTMPDVEISYFINTGRSKMKDTSSFELLSPRAKTKDVNDANNVIKDLKAIKQKILNVLKTTDEDFEGGFDIRLNGCDKYIEKIGDKCRENAYHTFDNVTDCNILRKGCIGIIDDMMVYHDKKLGWHGEREDIHVAVFGRASRTLLYSTTYRFRPTGCEEHEDAGVSREEARPKNPSGSLTEAIGELLNYAKMYNIHKSTPAPAISMDIEDHLKLRLEGCDPWLKETLLTCATAVRDWVIEEYSRGVQEWVIGQYTPKIQEWVVEQYSHGVQYWVQDRLMPVIGKWIKANCVMKNDVTENTLREEVEKALKID